MVPKGMPAILGVFLVVMLLSTRRDADRGFMPFDINAKVFDPTQRV